ncbi:uncharacterized protein isoform X2 [Choristoneura fumiferana]|uniref:uncharacterized protein isoform X2 n=1 Tax=Choristoneura fumiferana TaxID=7141 RepID=UPI003D1557E4
MESDNCEKIHYFIKSRLIIMGSQYVKIFYGPYTSFHTTSHKPQKLLGTRDKLRKLGYRVDLIPVHHINYCLFVMIGHEIFRCDIQNLQFNTESDLDPVSQRAVEACLQASRKFRRARTHFWLRSLLEHRVFMQYGPKDYSPIEVNLKKYASCLECVNCCGILVRKNTEEESESNYEKIKHEILFPS